MSRNCTNCNRKDIPNSEDFCPNCHTALTERGEKIEKLQGSITILQEQNDKLNGSINEIIEKLKENKSSLQNSLNETPEESEKEDEVPEHKTYKKLIIWIYLGFFVIPVIIYIIYLIKNS
ncbi:MAG: hypothetical protein LBV69_07350 [Bacteroidales bacterium]|jgi:RNA polymerase subunit RPABC4/transcription elongation factor Spt4|nr:hypothetical protein [Bacteroidales bacterium]